MKKIYVLLSIVYLNNSSVAADYPMTIENCGVSQKIVEEPKSIVTMGQAGTEFLYALGQAKKVKGTSVWFTRVVDEFQEIDSKIERLSENGPSFEAVVKKRPDLVVVQYPYYVGEKGTVGTREQFTKLGINSYILPTSCFGKTKLLKSNRFSPEVIYYELAQLAKILNVEKKGEILISQLKKKELLAKEKAKKLEKSKNTVLFWFSSAKVTSDPWVAGKRGVPQYFADTLGLKNIIDLEGEWPAVSWEAIAKENPSIIVIAEMKRRKNGMDDYNKKITFLENDPVASQIDAVKNGNIIVLDSQALDPTLRSFDGLNTLVDKLLEK